MSLKHDDKTLTQTIGNARVVWRMRSMREGLQNELVGTHGTQLSGGKILNTCTVLYGSHQPQVAIEKLLSKKLVRLKDRGLTFI